MVDEERNELTKKLIQYTQYSQGDLEKRCELHYEDIMIDNFDFSKYDLNNALFLGVYFENCDFTNVYLSGSYFGGSTMNNCILKNNTLRKANWDCITVSHTEISKLDLFRTTIMDASFDHVNITSSKLERCLLSSSHINNVEFYGCSIIDTDFGYTLQNVEFYECSIIDTDFGCTLQNVIFKKCILREVTGQDKGITIKYTTLKNVEFDECDLKDCDFSGCEFHNVILKNCVIENVQGDFENEKTIIINSTIE